MTENTGTTYKIPDEYFFRLHHIRPRFKEDVEEVLLYVATSISELSLLPKKEFKEALNEVIKKYKKNLTAQPKTIDNWRTEISALFSFIQYEESSSYPSLMANRLADHQYLDEFFNYFLYTFQYPGGHNKPNRVIEQIQAGIRFKPCSYILQILLEGSQLLDKSFSITAEELTQCAYYDLRVTRDGRLAKDVASQIIINRQNQVKYDYKYDQLKTSKGEYISSGDVYRYAGDILDYMLLANLLTDKGTGYYYYLNEESNDAINYHLEYPVWFSAYDEYYTHEHANGVIKTSVISIIEPLWFDYVNHFGDITPFSPQLSTNELASISEAIGVYYNELKGGKAVPTKIIGDYGESLILAHEYLRTKGESNRQHLINKLPTPLGVGFDLQSIEIPKKKRYIEVKTTRSKKAINNKRFKLTPNEWDSADTLRGNYFIYYLRISNNEKRVFVINNPVQQYIDNKLKVDRNLVVEFSEEAGEWYTLLEV